MKFGASFVITGREVRELHPVSRHVRYHFSGQATRPPTWVPRFLRVLSKYPRTSEQRRRNCVQATATPSVCAGAWESFTAKLHFNTTSTGGDPSVIDFPFASTVCGCVCVCVLTVRQYCGEAAPLSPLSPAPLPHSLIQDTVEQEEALSPLPAQKKKKKNFPFFFLPLMSTWLQGYVIITVKLSREMVQK